MTGQELYEEDRKFAEEMGFYDLPPWEALTPWRQANWNTMAAEHTRKQLDDREDEE